MQYYFPLIQVFLQKCIKCFYYFFINAAKLSAPDTLQFGYVVVYSGSHNWSCSQFCPLLGSLVFCLLLDSFGFCLLLESFGFCLLLESLVFGLLLERLLVLIKDYFHCTCISPQVLQFPYVDGKRETQHSA